MELQNNPQRQHGSSDSEHHHHHSHHHRSRVKPVVYCILSFFLALVLFALSVCVVLKTTVFSKNFILSSINSCGYSAMIREELKKELTSLGNASGLDKEFVSSFVDGLNIDDAIEDYISNFYSNRSTLVETTAFKQQLLYSIDDYIKENNIDRESADEENISYLVDAAADIYTENISIPFFSVIANYISKYQSPLITLILSLGAAALIIIAIIFFSNKYKHRRFRYISYAFGGAFLATAAVPAIVFISNMISKVNINIRSLYNLFVNYMNGLFMNFWIYAGIYLFIAVLTLILCRKYYNKVTSH